MALKANADSNGASLINCYRFFCRPDLPGFFLRWPWLALRFYLGRHRADRIWRETDVSAIRELGTVKRLSILPLVDRLSADDTLMGEAGVSYLIRADEVVILFDVGLNAKDEHPSPLLKNMERLGVAIEHIDQIVISHLHSDHVGGLRAMKKRTFALSSEPMDLQHIPAHVPVPMLHPTAAIHVVPGPKKISPGVASLGPIPRQLFFLGWTEEQALAIHVEGKGIILISGCGHPTIQRMTARTRMLFGEQAIFGIIGGLHFPATFKGLWRVVGSGKPPWNPINKKDVNSAISALQSINPRIIALSPHDSCSWSIQAFREAFGEAHRDLLVGQEIVIA